MGLIFGSVIFTVLVFAAGYVAGYGDAKDDAFEKRCKE